MHEVLTYITEPLSFEFMQRALMIAVMIGVTGAVFSCFLVMKGWALLGDAVSHAILPGVALAYLVGLPLSIGAFVAGLFCAHGIGYIKAHSRVKEDAVMGIVFSAMFALGLVLISKIESDVHLMHILFGNVLGTAPRDVIEVTLIAGPALCLMLFKRKDLMLYCFDPVHAGVIGLPVKRLHFMLLALLALVVVAALKTAGIILVIAMLIAPGATGFILARRFDAMMVIAVGCSVLSCFAGVIISYHLDAATAPLIILIQAGFFIMALIMSGVFQGREIKTT